MELAFLSAELYLGLLAGELLLFLSEDGQKARPLCAIAMGSTEQRDNNTHFRCFWDMLSSSCFETVSAVFSREVVLLSAALKLHKFWSKEVLEFL